MAGIQTGVDRLVALIHEKKRIALDEAAKALGVSKMVVQEWSDFLEEEGLLTIKYSLSKVYLVEKVLSKGELVQKERQFQDQRETFVNRVDSAIQQLELETASFEKFKNEFQEIKRELGSDLELLEADATQLKEYDDLKRGVVADIQKQHTQFESKQKEADVALQRQYKQYHDVLHQLSLQEKRLADQKKKVHSIINSERAVDEKLKAYSGLLEKLKGRVNEETKQLGADEDTLEKLQQVAETFKDQLELINKQNLAPLMRLKAEHDDKVKKFEQKILQKATSIERTLKNPSVKKPKVKKQIQTFFKRKKLIEKMLNTIDKDKSDLLRELNELQQRAAAYQLGKTAVRLEELENKLATVEERKKGLANHITKFIKTLH